MRKNKQTNKQTNTTMTPNGNIPQIKKITSRKIVMKKQIK